MREWPSRTRGYAPRYAKPPAPWWQRPFRWVVAEPLRMLWVGATVILIGSAPFGGWQAVESDAVDTVAPGEQISADPFEITIERAFTSPRPGSSFAPLDNGTYVVVIGTLVSTHDSPLFTPFREAVTADVPEQLNPLSGEPVLERSLDEPISILSSIDQTSVSSVGPELEYDIAWVWITGADPPEALTVTVNAHTWRRDGITRSVFVWADPARTAVVSVDVEYREPWTPETEDDA